MAKIILRKEDIKVGDHLYSNRQDMYFDGVVSQLGDRTLIMDIPSLPPQEIPYEDLFFFSNCRHAVTFYP